MKILSQQLVLGIASPGTLFALTSVIVFALATATSAQDIVPDGARVSAAGQVAFTEGPCWHPDGSVYFTDIENNRIMRRDRSGSLGVFRQPSGKANGLVFDLEGRLLACEGGNRRVTRTEADGAITVLADKYEGHAFNSPNDITVDGQGFIYFTDPRYGNRESMEMVNDLGEGIEGVYRIAPDGQIKRILSAEVQRPNGIAISPDGNTLYVADNANDAHANARKIWKFDLSESRDVVANSQKLVFDWGSDRGPDGMAIDSQGRLYVTAGLNYAAPPYETATKFKAAVYVIDPASGELLETIPVPQDMITNCAFGGDDLKTLFITSGHRLWQIPVNTPGFVQWLKNK